MKHLLLAALTVQCTVYVCCLCAEAWKAGPSLCYVQVADDPPLLVVLQKQAEEYGLGLSCSLDGWKGKGRQQ